MLSSSRRTLHLGPVCCSNRVIIHELLHILGAYHEHARPDRQSMTHPQGSVVLWYV